jgi:hypothetical protein
MLRLCALIVLKDRCTSPAISRCESSLQKEPQDRQLGLAENLAADARPAGSPGRCEAGPPLGPREPLVQDAGNPHTRPRPSPPPRRSAAPPRGGRAAEGCRPRASSEYAISIEATPRRANSLARRRTVRGPRERPALAGVYMPFAEKAGLARAGSRGNQGDSALGVCDQRYDERGAVQVPRSERPMCSFVAASTVVDAFGITVPLPPRVVQGPGGSQSNSNRVPVTDSRAAVRTPMLAPRDWSHR